MHWTNLQANLTANGEIPTCAEAFLQYFALPDPIWVGQSTTAGLCPDQHVLPVLRGMIRNTASRRISHGSGPEFKGTRHGCPTE